MEKTATLSERGLASGFDEIRADLKKIGPFLCRKTKETSLVFLGSNKGDDRGFIITEELSCLAVWAA